MERAKITIFDTTLRDGEQSPGIALRAGEKAEIAGALERLRVDVIEAGFAASSPGDYEGVAAFNGTVHAIWTDSRRNTQVPSGCTARGLMEEVFTATVK